MIEMTQCPIVVIAEAANNEEDDQIKVLEKEINAFDGEI